MKADIIVYTHMIYGDGTVTTVNSTLAPAAYKKETGRVIIDTKKNKCTIELTPEQTTQLEL